MEVYAASRRDLANAIQSYNDNDSIIFISAAKVQRNSETAKDKEQKKARPLNSKMANADTLDGAGVNSGNALDAAKLQNNSETTKDKEQKRAMETASVSHDEEHQHAVISFANGAKVQQNFETAKDLAKKNCLLLHHSAPIAGASARQLMVLHSCLSCLQRKNQDARNCSVRQCAASGLLRPS